MAPNTANVRKILAILSERGEKVAEEITARIQQELVEVRLVADPEFLKLAHESSLANVATGLRILADGRPLPRTPPTHVSEAVRAAANAGVSLGTLLRAYRIAHAVCWSEWMRATEELDLPSRERIALLEHGSDFLFQFVDHVATLVTDEYAREREDFVRSIEERRVHVVRDVLDGVSNDGAGLSYDLALEHIGVMAWGARPEEAIRDVAARLDRRRLVVPAGDGVVWGWMGARESSGEAGGRPIGKIDPRDGTFLAFGEPAAGVAGFRQTHREAHDARRVALRLGRQVTRYDDVALEALAIRDERYARAFVARELGPLTGDDARSRRLRGTLRAYFATGQNAAAAASLGVHDQTVAYRLRTIEEQLGRTVSSRRAELETALRIEAFLTDGNGRGTAGRDDGSVRRFRPGDENPIPDIRPID